MAYASMFSLESNRPISVTATLFFEIDKLYVWLIVIAKEVGEALKDCHVVARGPFEL